MFKDRTLQVKITQKNSRRMFGSIYMHSYSISNTLQELNNIIDQTIQVILLEESSTQEALNKAQSDINYLYQ